MAAPHKTPPNILKLKGNPGKRKIETNIPEPFAGAYCPDWLSDYAKEEWDRVVGELQRLGLLTLIDQTSLAAYCQVFSRWREAEEKLREKGVVITTKQGNIIQNPAVGAANQALTLMHKYLVEFGMTPVARTKLINRGVEGKEDEFDKMKRRSGSAS